MIDPFSQMKRDYTAVNPPRYQILRTDGEGMIDDVVTRIYDKMFHVNSSLNNANHLKFYGRKVESTRNKKIVILSTSTSTQIPNEKTSKKKNDINKQHSKQANRQGKLRKFTKCLLNRFS